MRSTSTTPPGTGRCSTKYDTSKQTDFDYNDQDQLESCLDVATNETVSFTYNTGGDLIERVHPGVERATYSYDHFGRLVGVTLDAAADGSPDTVISYTLDALGRRVAKAINGVTTRRWLYGSFLYPSVEFDGDGIPVAYFVGNVIIKVNSGADDGTYRLIRDHLGSVRSVVNVGTGEIKQRLDYDSYGNVTLDTNPGFQPLGFAGGLYDIHTELVKFGFRDYDSATGRFITKDPIGLSGGVNVYLYAFSDPLNNLDITGLGVIKVGKLIIENASHVFKKYKNGTSDQIVEALNKNYHINAPELTESQARNIAEQVWGKDNVLLHPSGSHTHRNLVHEAENPVKNNHFQPRNRDLADKVAKNGGGHLYYKTPGWLAAAGGFGVGTFGNNAFGHGVDLLNPMGDVQFGVDLLGQASLDAATGASNVIDYIFPYEDYSNPNWKY